MDIGAQLSPSSVARDVVGLNRQNQRHNDADGSDETDNQRPERPICRVSSGSCGIPLSAKIGAVVIFAIGAWLLIFSGIRGLSDLVLSRRNRIQGMLRLLGGAALFGLCGVIWGGG